MNNPDAGLRKFRALYFDALVILAMVAVLCELNTVLHQSPAFVAFIGISFILATFAVGRPSGLWLRFLSSPQSHLSQLRVAGAVQ